MLICFLKYIKTRMTTSSILFNVIPAIITRTISINNGFYNPLISPAGEVNESKNIVLLQI